MKFALPPDPMSLEGGLDMYGLPGTRYGRNIPPEGRKVYFFNDNGYDSELETARKYFIEGQILTIKEIYVGRSSSEVEFIEFPGKRFNTVMFMDLKDEQL